MTILWAVSERSSMEKISKEDLRLIVIGSVLLFAVIIAGIIWLTHKDQKKALPVLAVAKTGVYAGWPVDDSSLIGLAFHYPAAWADVPSHSICTGALLTSLTPTAPEVSAALPTAVQYYIEVEKYGTAAASCRADGTNLSGTSFSSISSSTQLQHGAFKGDWLTFFAGGNKSFTATQPDTAVVTPNKYTGSQTTFKNAGTIPYKGKTYQISIITSSGATQSETPVSLNIASFKTSELYGDTLNILNSIQPN
jgi:hypothetical protein